MARLDARDKQLLGDAGVTLSDNQYVQAVAGLGLRGGKRRLGAGPAGIIWSAAPWSRPTSRRRQSTWSRQELLGFIEEWENLQKATPEPRVVIEPDPAAASDIDTFSLFRILGRQEARTGSVFISAQPGQTDLRLQMPMRVGAWQEDYEALGLEAIATAWPASSIMEFHPLSREHARCDVLILRGTVRTALRQILASRFIVRAALILLLGPADAPWQRMQGVANALLSETQAAGLSLITLQSAGHLASLFGAWAFELSHNTPLDIGLKKAFGETAALHLLSPSLIEAAALPTAARMLGRRLRVLAPSTRFALSGGTLERIGLEGLRAKAPRTLPRELARTLRTRADVLPYVQESQGGTALAEISAAEKEARYAEADVQPDRVLQADLFAIRDGKANKQLRPFVVDQPHRLEAFIGPPGGGALQVDKAFPDTVLDWQNADQFTLGVVFSEPNQWDVPQVGTLVLRRYGTSTRCRFDFTPTKAGPFRARLTIQYRGRVLETALLEAKVETSDQAAAAAVDGTPRLSDETKIHGTLTTLDDRRRFDANLVLNNTVTGQATVQVAGREGAIVASLSEIEQQLERISARLRDVANNAKRYTKGLDSKDSTAMLIKLATHGHALFGRLVRDYIDVSSAAKELRDSEYLQIVAAKPEAVVPLELVYQYAPPADDAKLCPNAIEALEAGRCPADCDTKTSPATHVCPMGFWGLRKVIERHVHNPKLATGAAFIAAVEPIGSRSVIPLKGAALLAASKNVKAVARTALEKAVARQWKPSGKVATVGKWAEWKKAVGEVKPTLVVALPHSDGVNEDISLEISGDILVTRFLTEDYLRPSHDQPPPLVLLLGCDVAGKGDAKAYTSHVQNFRYSGAPVILGTLAIIEGSAAAAAAGIIVEQLVKVVGSKPDRFGEVLRQAKREAMKKGLLMVLGLVGIGDADWQLKL